MKKSFSVSKSVPKSIELNVRKSVITQVVDLEDTGAVHKEALQIDQAVPVEPKNFKLTDDHITKWLHKASQSGYQNKSIKTQTLFPNEDPSAPGKVPVGKSSDKSMNISQDYTNEVMKKSKFGYNPNVPDNATTDAKIQTFGATDDVIQNRQKNGCESDVGFQGWLGNSLWASNYLNSEGVGKFK